MEPHEAEFLDSLKSLSTAKDKIFEISSVMINHKTNYSASLVSVWLKEFQSLKDEKKRLAMLFVMNDAIIKSSKESRGDEYVKEFPKVIGDVIQSLADFKSEFLLEELRKIVMVWKHCLFAVCPSVYLLLSMLCNQLERPVKCPKLLISQFNRS